MLERKSILVIGGTGAQGGSVVDYLLKEGRYNVRVITRDPNSDKAVQLKNRNVEVIAGDLNDVQSLVRAMDGVYGVFGVTNFWDPSVGYTVEIQQGKNIGDACKRSNVKHLVFSTLDRDSDVPHFESKVQAEDYIRSLGIPTTFLVTSFYFENFKTFFPPNEINGRYVFSIAQREDTKVPMYSVKDTGGWVVKCFNDPKHIGKDVSAVGEYLSYPELVKTFSRVVGKPAIFNEIPLESFREAGFPGAKELAANLQFFDDIFKGKKVDRRRDGDIIWNGAHNWEAWLREKWGN